MRMSLFELNRRGMLLATRPARIDSVLNAAVPRDIIAPTELSRITDDGQVDVIDSVTSTLLRESIGGFMFRRELPLLRGGSDKLCTLFPATLLHVRTLGQRSALEAFTLTANPNDDALVGRHRLTVAPASRLRWGNGDSRRCLLLTDREVLIVSAPADPSTGVSPQLTALGADEFANQLRRLVLHQAAALAKGARGQGRAGHHMQAVGRVRGRLRLDPVGGQLLSQGLFSKTPPAKRTHHNPPLLALARFHVAFTFASPEAFAELWTCALWPGKGS
jgi:hypothetical protein